MVVVALMAHPASVLHPSQSHVFLTLRQRERAKICSTDWWMCPPLLFYTCVRHITIYTTWTYVCVYINSEDTLLAGNNIRDVRVTCMTLDPLLSSCFIEIFFFPSLIKQHQQQLKHHQFPRRALGILSYLHVHIYMPAREYTCIRTSAICSRDRLSAWERAPRPPVKLCTVLNSRKDIHQRFLTNVTFSFNFVTDRDELSRVFQDSITRNTD